MRLSNSFFFTLREDLKDEDSVSSNLLTRAGMIKRSSAGVYMMLPLGFKTLTNIENIIREEMNKIESQEMQMPALVPFEIYQKSGRDEIIGDSMYQLKDRSGREFALGPTHEELFAIAAKSKIRSYKDMPFSIYQFQTKYRDEARARFGMIRAREFVMKDAYTFDTDNESLDKSYQAMKQAYNNVFDRLQLDYRVVQADTGIMGGMLSEEYQAISSIGEDIIVSCEGCDFARNLEIAETLPLNYTSNVEKANKEFIETPNVRTIEEVAEFLDMPKNHIVKTLIYKTDDEELVAVLINGNHELNETKLQQLLQKDVEPADETDILELTGAQVGFIGPVGLNCKIYADESISTMINFAVGANKDDHHLINVNLDDFDVEKYADLRMLDDNDVCPICGGKLHFDKAIEVGNIFKLGTSYSEAFDLNYLDSDNQLHPVVMGSYGIGLGRTMSALAEAFNDDKGLTLPMNIAPYKVAIIIISTKNEHQVKYANELYEELQALGIDTILDDRDERAGVKFNDFDLIGTPIRITVGRGLETNVVEYKERTSDEVVEVATKDIIKKIKNTIKESVQ